MREREREREGETNSEREEQRTERVEQQRQLLTERYAFLSGLAFMIFLAPSMSLLSTSIR